MCVQGQATDIAIQAEEILKLKRQINNIYAKHTGQLLETIGMFVQLITTTQYKLKSRTKAAQWFPPFACFLATKNLDFRQRRLIQAWSARLKFVAMCDMQITNCILYMDEGGHNVLFWRV